MSIMNNTNKPMVVGLYGLPGTGKSFLLDQLKGFWSVKEVLYFEGSEVVFSMVTGGCEAFQKSTAEEKLQYRQWAIKSIQKQCAESGKIGVVTGRLTLWDGTGHYQLIDTPEDWLVYTHILYLNLEPSEISRRVIADTSRSRPIRDETSIRKWKTFETSRLEDLCSKNQICLDFATPNKIGSFVSDALSVLNMAYTGHLQKAAEVSKAATHRVFLHEASGKGAARALSSLTRDIEVHGPVLFEGHEQIGKYLAVEYLAREDVIGLDARPMHDVRGNPSDRYEFKDEKKILVVAIMRGGLPLAMGVWKTMPNAMLAFHREHQELCPATLSLCSTVVLADFVVNSGRSIEEFAISIRKQYPKMKIVVVAGVTQAESIQEGSVLFRAAQTHGSFHLVTLRVSENKYTGSGVTDTGNRLFNTTHQE